MWVSDNEQQRMSPKAPEPFGCGRRRPICGVALPQRCKGIAVGQAPCIWTSGAPHAAVPNTPKGSRS
jgi:hypothetical protein